MFIVLLSAVTKTQKQRKTSKFREIDIPHFKAQFQYFVPGYVENLMKKTKDHSSYVLPSISFKLAGPYLPIVSNI